MASFGQPTNDDLEIEERNHNYAEGNSIISIDEETKLKLLDEPALVYKREYTFKNGATYKGTNIYIYKYIYIYIY